ncbi:MAG: hypothetical protein ISN28_09995 [Ectothiorhodospiraceae bacterium AqS1]|nr:hypothetical protein [Ectothiorhodospiraceae bacterium AqS1]
MVYAGSVRELLNSLADQTAMNLDIDDDVDGYIQLNAYNQTIGQLLERIQKQMPMRIETIGDTLIILADNSYLRQYHVAFPDLTRTYSSSVDGSVASSGSGSVGSASIGISKDGTGSVWQDLLAVIGTVMEGLAVEEAGTEDRGPFRIDEDDESLETDREQFTSLAEREARPVNEAFVHALPDAGLLIFYGNSRQHEIVRSIIRRVETSARRQVLLQATVVEIALNNQYQQGIDWSLFLSDRGTFGKVLGRPTNESLETFKEFLELVYPIDEEEAGSEAQAQANQQYINSEMRRVASQKGSRLSQTGYGNLTFGIGELEAAISLLDRFGDTRVVSSPRISTLNGQPALLKVVEDNVYFQTTISRDEEDDGSITETIEVTQEVIPVGFVVNVYPQVGDDGTIILSMRPSISRVTGTAIPPSAGGLESQSAVPIVSVKEIETLMLLQDGQTAVMGGLIEDQTTDATVGVPGASEFPGIGDLFTKKDQSTRRVEYIIFVSAKIINNPSIQDMLPSDETLRRDASGSLFNQPRVGRVPRVVE